MVGWGEIIGGIILGGAALLGVIFLVKITYNAICDYLNKAKEIPNAATCELIKNRIEDGKYRVVANVFNSSHKQLESQTWEGEKLDEELESEFEGKNKIIYDLRS